MLDRRTTFLLERLRSIAARRERFSYDVRGDSYVNTGIVAPYRLEEGKGQRSLEAILQHALDHDAVVSGWRDPADGVTHFTSCRLFTDAHNAVSFAQKQQQRAVYNWNRDAEIPVQVAPAAGPALVTGPEEN